MAECLCASHALVPSPARGSSDHVLNEAGVKQDDTGKEVLGTAWYVGAAWRSALKLEAVVTNAISLQQNSSEHWLLSQTFVYTLKLVA